MLSDLKPGHQLISAFENLLLQRAFRHKNRINLSSGNPSYEPFRPAVDAAKASFSDTTMRLYASGAGKLAQRERLLSFCEDMGLSSEIHSLDHTNIVYGLGITHLFSTTLSALIKNRESRMREKKPVIIMATPGYGLFSMQPENAGYDIETIPLREEDGWILRPEYLEKRIAEINAEKDRYVSVFYNMNPHNPTGAITPPERLQQLSKILRATGVFTIDDMAYHGLEYGVKAIPMAQTNFDNTITFFSASKAFCMPQARAAFACGPDWLMKEINTQISLNMISLPSSLMATANACFGEGMAAERERYLANNLEGYANSFNLLRAVVDGLDSFEHTSLEARDRMKKIIERIFSNRQDVAEITKHGIPQIRLMNRDIGAGYFACLEVEGLDTLFYGERRLSNSFEFSAVAVDQGRTLTLPLIAAMTGKEHKAAMRVTFGGMSDERMVKGLRNLRATLNALPTKPDSEMQQQLEQNGRALDHRFDF